MDNLKGRTVSAVIWNLTERVGLQVVQFLPTVILARLLAPEQFGLVGMLAIFILLANTFLDSGFGTALIQKKAPSHLDECSIFYFNILVGVVVVGLLYVVSPWIAEFYHQPLLTSLMRWLSLGILINSFGLIQTTLLVRALDFKTQVKANLFAALVSAIIGVALAYQGLGVWSLVAQNLSEILIATITLWFLCKWRPALIFSLTPLKEMFGFGSRMLLSSLVSTFFNNFYQVFIGKVFSATSLGYYTRASSIRSILMDTTSNTFGRVMYPAFAAIRDDIERLKRAYRKSILLTTFVHFPLMIGLLAVARPVVLLLFTEKWEAVVPLLQLMCLGGLLYPMQLINLDILKVKGRSDLFFWITVLKQSMLLGSIFLTYRWGLNAILIGQFLVSLVSYFLNSFYSERLISYAVKDQLLDVAPSFGFTCLMGGIVFGVGVALGGAPVLVLLVAQAGVGAAIYLGLHILFKTDALQEALELVRRVPALKGRL